MAKYLGVKYCLGLNSGGSALFLALKLSGVTQGTPVLTNSYTLAPVPGAIRHAGGVPVLGGGTSFFYFGPSVLVCATCGGGRSEAGHCFHLFSFLFFLRLLIFTHFGETPVTENLFPSIFWHNYRVSHKTRSNLFSLISRLSDHLQLKVRTFSNSPVNSF